MILAAFTLGVHLTTLGGIALITLVICGIGLQAKSDGSKEKIRRSLGYFTLAFWVFYTFCYLRPSVFRWEVSLPLQVCDLLGLVAGWALISQNTFSRAILYFLGLSLSTQGLVTPTGDHPPETLSFWLFWGLHGTIFFCALFDLIVCSYRPVLRSFFLSVISGLVYLTIIFPLNLVFDWNYGYVGKTVPDQTTALDFLGPWPMRVVYIVLLAISMQLLLLLPWLRSPRGKSAESIPDEHIK